jgi:hypothetical protein
MCGFVVDDEAAVPVGVVMRIEAVGQAQRDNGHQERRSNRARLPTGSSQHRRTTIEPGVSSVKHPKV